MTCWKASYEAQPWQVNRMGHHRIFAGCLADFGGLTADEIPGAEAKAHGNDKAF